jgi:hypothetical protein
MASPYTAPVKTNVCLLLFWASLLIGLSEITLAQVPTVASVGYARTLEPKLDLPPSPGPVEVTLQFHLLHLQRIDDETEEFEFSGVLTLGWHDQRQAFDPDLEGVPASYFHGDYQFNELSPGWYPQVVITNALEAPTTQGVLLRVEPDGTSVLTQVIHVVARANLKLHRYPFDNQQLEAVFDVMGFNADQVKLLPAENPATMDSSRVHTPQWHLSSISASEKTIEAPAAGPSARSSAVSVALDVHRKPFFMLRLVIFPLALIMVLSWSVFWMERTSLGDRMSVSFVGILTAVAYQIMMSDFMPHISDISFLNSFVILSMVTMAATVVVNLAVGECDKRGEMALGDRIDTSCRWIFPLVFVTLTVVALLVTFFLL